MVEIRQLSAAEGREYVSALADVLIDCVDGGASVSFMSPLARETAESFFAKTVEEMEQGHRILLGAFIGSELVGTVQIITATPPNQPHRADVAKLLVRRSARAQGVGRRLMEHVEEVSRCAGKTLLVLDTVTGESGERLYLRLGWTAVGVIPEYALFPDGRPCDTTVFFKKLQ